MALRAKNLVFLFLRAALVKISFFENPFDDPTFCIGFVLLFLPYLGTRGLPR
jgi:hypothetical protein